jgi:hypothetical protein
MPEADSKRESSENDPEHLARLLEIELAQKRATWKNTSARYSKIRTASLLFLLLVVIGSILAFVLFFSRVNEERANRPAAIAATPSP